MFGGRGTFWVDLISLRSRRVLKEREKKNLGDKFLVYLHTMKKKNWWKAVLAFVVIFLIVDKLSPKLDPPYNPILKVLKNTKKEHFKGFAIGNDKGMIYIYAEIFYQDTCSRGSTKLYNSTSLYKKWNKEETTSIISKSIAAEFMGIATPLYSDSCKVFYQSHNDFLNQMNNIEQVIEDFKPLNLISLDHIYRPSNKNNFAVYYFSKYHFLIFSETPFDKATEKKWIEGGALKIDAHWYLGEMANTSIIDWLIN